MTTLSIHDVKKIETTTPRYLQDCKVWLRDITITCENRKGEEQKFQIALFSYDHDKLDLLDK